ncbi:hypothetical protein BJP36_41745 [Moorena producens JHB]|uniref:Uncharacterized protein n=1 Tax=Moorena producens (strain JHB) TaxID=1454205 RepID=A0A9Q9SSK7_MOOP1|nr:hypothetical protein [Moorena producens]WAN68890.1 hypothetical protein BJP36_41745 [Moorena producens JHB]
MANLIRLRKAHRGSRESGIGNRESVDPVVRYGAGCSNPDEEVENESKPAPNAPYATLCLLPLAFCLLPLAFFNNSCL